MRADKAIEILLWAICIPFILILIIGIPTAFKSSTERREKCERLGGVMYETRDSTQCIKKGSIILLK